MTASHNTQEQDLLLDLCIQTLGGQGDKVAAYIAEHPTMNEQVLKKTKSGHSLLYYAVKAGNLALIETLAKLGAPLHESYDQMSLRDIVKRQLFLADPDARDDLHKVEQFLSHEDIPYSQRLLADFEDKFRRRDDDASQQWILAPLRVMDYTVDSIGYCSGISHMGIQAMVLDERNEKNQNIHLKQFTKRIERLEHHANNPKQFVYEMDVAHHKNLLYRLRINSMLDNDAELQALRETQAVNMAELKEATKQSLLREFLSEDEHTDLEIKNFLNGIEIYQKSFTKDESLLGRKITWQSDVAPMPLAANRKVEELGGMALVDHFTGVYDDKELLAILQAIKKHAPAFGKTVAIELSANNHSISVGYDPKLDKWIFIDANAKPKVQSYRGGTFDELIRDKIMEGLFVEKTSKIILSANFISTVADSKNLFEKVIKPLHAEPTFVAANEVTAEKLKVVDSKKDSWLDRAECNGDDKVIQQINQFKEKSKNLSALARSKFLSLIRRNSQPQEGGELPEAAKIAKEKNDSLEQALQMSDAFEKADHTLSLPVQTTQSKATTTKLHQSFIERYNSNDHGDLNSSSIVKLVEPFRLDRQYATLDAGERQQFREYLFSLPKEQQEKLLISRQTSDSIEALRHDHCTKLTEDLHRLFTSFSTIENPNDRDAFIEAYQRLSDDHSRKVLLKHKMSEADVKSLKEHFSQSGAEYTKHVDLCASVLNNNDSIPFPSLPSPVKRPLMR